MNAKNSDLSYHILNQLFLQFLPLCEREFWKEVHNKNGLNRIYKIVNGRNEERKRKNIGCFRNRFFKPPSSL